MEYGWAFQSTAFQPPLKPLPGSGKKELRSSRNSSSYNHSTWPQQRDEQAQELSQDLAGSFPGCPGDCVASPGQLQQLQGAADRGLLRLRLEAAQDPCGAEERLGATAFF